MLLRTPAATKWRDWKLWYHGEASLLGSRLNALLCSKACPGEKIIAAMDLAQRWRSENRAVISGFHTAVEKECLRIFLRGPQTVVVCPARGIDPFQLPVDWETKYKRSELLILSPFDPSVRRATKETAEIRNRLVVDLATAVHVIYASPGGHLEKATNSSTSSSSPRDESVRRRTRFHDPEAAPIGSQKEEGRIKKIAGGGECLRGSASDSQGDKLA